MASWTPMPMIGDRYLFQGISLYFHIPFCTRKCPYCHFFVLPDKDCFKDQLLEALAIEWQYRLAMIKQFSIISIYFGGGTPTLFGVERLAKVLNWIQSTCSIDLDSIEVTLEANPEHLSSSVLHNYRKIGFNRLSLGVQSLQDDELKRLGREHCSKTVYTDLEQAVQAGFKNISIDLMYETPLQTLNSWQDTLIKACHLPISHISLYNLSIEPHTVFYKHRRALQPILPSAETGLIMFKEAQEILKEGNFCQYEISAFCKDDAFSRHNTGYWIGRPFIGFGPSASSFFDNKRFRNIPNLNRYHRLLAAYQDPSDLDDALDDISRRKELLAINLRLLDGVNLDTFEYNHGKLDSTTLNVLELLKRKGLIEQKGRVIKLSEQGIYLHDEIAVDLI